MFSQFRNAVEHLAAQPVRRSTSQDSDTSNIMSRTNSSEGSAPSSAQLADSALSNIRKSLQVQRSSSPARTSANGMTIGGVHDLNKPRSRLEERLRASLSFGIGEVSNPSTEASTNAANTPASTKASTPLLGTDVTPPSPTHTPLPDSPTGSPTSENEPSGILTSLLSTGDPLGVSSVASSAGSLPHLPGTELGSHQEPPTIVTTYQIDDDMPLTQPTPTHYESKSVNNSVVEKLERVAELEEDEEFHGRRYAEAQMPLPPSPPPGSPDPPPPEPQPAVLEDTGRVDPSPVTTESPQVDPDTGDDPATATMTSTGKVDGDSDVEALRQQLKRFKERFSGREIMDVGWIQVNWWRRCLLIVQETPSGETRCGQAATRVDPGSNDSGYGVFEGIYKKYQPSKRGTFPRRPSIWQDEPA